MKKNKIKIWILFKYFALFIDCISEINNTQVYNANNIKVVMPIYNLIEHSHTYLQESGCLWQYLRDESAVNGKDVSFFCFNEANPTKSFNSKAKIIGQTEDSGRKDVETIVSLKHLHCETNIILFWSDNCVIVSIVSATFSIADTKCYVPAITLATEDNSKLLKQLKPGFKRTINWKKHQWKNKQKDWTNT